MDVFRRKRWVQLLVENGQNPMIAYAGINNLVIPLLALTTVDQCSPGWRRRLGWGSCAGRSSRCFWR